MGVAHVPTRACPRCGVSMSKAVPMPKFPMLDRRRPLHVAMSALMVGLFIAFYAVLAVFHYQQGARHMLDEANRVFGLIGRQTTEVVRTLLMPAEAVIAVLAASELPRAFDPAGVNQWLHLLSTGLAQNPSADAMFVAFGDGSFILLRPLSSVAAREVSDPPAGATWLAQVVDRTSGVPRGRYGFYDARLEIVERRPVPGYAYDPRERDWYRQAQAAPPDTTVRTRPYVYFTTGEVGMTIARRHRRADVVVGIDVGVSALSKLLQQQAITPGAQLAIFDADGNVVAYHDPGRLSDASAAASAVLPTARQVGAMALAVMQERRQAGGAVAVSGREGASLREVDGRAWFYRYDAVADAATQPLYLAIAAPRQELLADAIQAQRLAVWVSLAALCVMIPIVLVVVRAVSRPLRFLARDAEAIERFDFAGADHPGSRITEVDDLARAMRNMKHTLRRFLEISSALTAEGQFDRLLDRVLRETIAASRARGGQIHLLDADGRQLEPTAVRSGDAAGDPAGMAPLVLGDSDSASPALQAATGQRTVLADLRREVQAQALAASAAFDRLQVNRFQALALPLRNRKQELIGTLELHFTEAAADAPWQIDPARVAFIEALSGTAAVAIDNQRLLMEQKALLQSFIELVAGAIDAKSPYTGGHCQRVPELAKLIAEAACAQTTGPFADYRLSEEQWEELHIAAWLHDCGKVTTPEYVVDKATKLETLCDRLHEVRTRFEVLKRDVEIGLCREALAAAGVATDGLQAALAQAHAELDEEFAFVAACNQGGEFMDPARVERLRRIGSRTWLRTLDDRIGLSHEELQRKNRVPATPLPALETLLADKPEHLLPRSDRDRFDADNPWGFRTDPPEHLFHRGELHNLAIARGTLNDEERHKINDHMVQTIKMLAQLPFPRHLRNVPEIAGGHHEKMDGSGYPRRLVREQLSVSARMMAVADVFEALTAADRPYKRGKTLTESLQIMARMAETGHIDAEVFALFLQGGVHLAYARRFMRAEQIDEVEIERFLPKALA